MNSILWKAPHLGANDIKMTVIQTCEAETTLASSSVQKGDIRKFVNFYYVSRK